MEILKNILITSTLAILIIYSFFVPNHGSLNHKLSWKYKQESEDNGNLVVNLKKKNVILEKSLTFSSYLGGNDHDIPKAIDVNINGSYFVVGATQSSDFNTSGPGSDIILSGAQDGFITKFSKSGKINFSTYLGGSGNDFIADIESDRNGDFVVVGYTLSSDFPTFGPFADTTFGGGLFDGFLSKFSWDGNMIFSTYIGGSSFENAWGVAIDEESNIYVSGYTSSTDFVTTGINSNSTYGGGVRDGFVQKYNSSGYLLYSTFLGGNNAEIAYEITTDSSQNMFITGYTESTNFPTSGPYATNTITGTYDIFVTKINTTGNIEFSTYVGGSSISNYANSFQNEQGNDILVDAQNNILILGYSNSVDFPTLGPNSNSTYGGGNLDMVLVKIDPQGQLIYSTYIGGSGEDNGESLRQDKDGQTYIFGYSSSNDIINAGTADKTLAGSFTQDNYLMIFNSTNNLVWSSFLGGTDDDPLQGGDIDEFGNLYIASRTKSTDYNITGQYADSTYGGGIWDAAVSVFKGPDTQFPIITLLNELNNTLVGSNYPLNFNIIDENLDTVFYHWDNMQDTMIVSPFVINTPTANGIHFLVISANDTFGNTKISNFQFNIDLISPVISLVNITNNSLISAGQSIQLSISDEYLSSVSYNWDNGPNIDLFAPYSVNAPIVNGSHTLTILASDSSGNSEEKTYHFILDLTPPTILLLNRLNESTINIGDKLSFDISGSPHIVFYNWDNTANLTLNYPYDIIISVSTGVHVFNIYANDSSNNIAALRLEFIIAEVSQSSEPIPSTSDGSDITDTSQTNTNPSINSSSQNSDSGESNILTLSIPFLLAIVILIYKKPITKYNK